MFKGKNTRITDFLYQECIKIPLSNIKKTEIIEELLGVILETCPDIDRQVAYKSLMEREKIETTGIGSGVALPHARIKGLKRSRFAFGIAPKGIDFKSLGGKPVTSIFLILFPEKEANTQLYVLARLSRFLNNKNFLKKLSACKTGQQVIDVFTQYEKDDFS